jgi:hypothetical protein
MVTEQTLPRAEREVLDDSPDCGAYLWTGHINGRTVRWVVHDPELVLYVRARWLRHGMAVELVEDDGKIHGQWVYS